MTIYNKRTAFLMNFWSKVRSNASYKVLFVILMGLYGLLIGIFFALLLLGRNGYKSFYIPPIFSTLVAIALSPFQYKIYDKKYKELKAFEEAELRKQRKKFE